MQSFRINMVIPQVKKFSSAITLIMAKLGYLQIFKILQYRNTKQLKAFWDQLELGICQKGLSQGILMLLQLHMLTFIWTRYITATFWRETVWNWALLFPFVQIIVIRGTIREYLSPVLKCVHLEQALSLLNNLFYLKNIAAFTLQENLSIIYCCHTEFKIIFIEWLIDSSRENKKKKTTTFALLKLLNICQLSSTKPS